jgi:hypothetical protein
LCEGIFPHPFLFLKKPVYHRTCLFVAAEDEWGKYGGLLQQDE